MATRRRSSGTVKIIFTGGVIYAIYYLAGGFFSGNAKPATPDSAQLPQTVQQPQIINNISVSPVINTPVNTEQSIHDAKNNTPASEENKHDESFEEDSTDSF